MRIIEPSERTAFAYRIEGGMDARDLDEIEAMDSGYVTGENWPSIVSESVDVRHRMRYMRGRSLGFRYLGTVDPNLPTGTRSRARSSRRPSPATCPRPASPAERSIMSRTFLR